MWLTKKKSFPFLFCLFRGSEGVCWLPCWRWFWWQGKRCASSPVSSSVECEYFQKVCWKRWKELRPKCISQLFTFSWWVQNQFEIETHRVFFSKVTHIPALFFEIVATRLAFCAAADLFMWHTPCQRSQSSPVECQRASEPRKKSLSQHALEWKCRTAKIHF